MDFDEHRAKELLSELGLKVPEGVSVSTGDEAKTAAEELRGPVVVKPLLRRGGRGKQGWIRFATDPVEAQAHAVELLTLTGVARVRVERRLLATKELYAAVVTDRSSRSPLLMFSERGGVDIESIDESGFIKRPVDIRRGPTPMTLDAFPRDVRETLATLYEAYIALDAELVEINPLALTDMDELVALDAKLVIDDGALHRHEELSLPSVGGTALEQRAREAGLYYVQLDGDIGVLANGAGLTMATLDAVRSFGGRPANFMEIGGDAYKKATEALSIVLGNPNVRSLLVNLCGAYARTDVMIDGFLAGWSALAPEVPVSFSIHGTGQDRARARVREVLGLTPFEAMDDAVKEAVQLG